MSLVRKLLKRRKTWEPAEFTGPRPVNVCEVYSEPFNLRSDIVRLIKPGGIGIELGVARGEFSEVLLEKSNLAFLYSVDMWAGDRRHDTEQYKQALKRLDKYRTRNSCLRMRFNEAVSLFPNNYFDFIYVDGYAHTGQEDGRTFEDWWTKLKPGGLFAGDDYAPRWPKVMEAVNRFAKSKKLELMLLEPTQQVNNYSSYPTWLAFKP